MAQISINVDKYCQIPEEKLHILVKLFNDFLPDVAIPKLAHLQGILIIPDSTRNEVVNELLHAGKEQGTYVAGTESHACAVAVETDAELRCFIVLDESFVQQINPQKPNDAEIVTTLLEEMFHVRLYSILWKQQGYLYPHFDCICTSELFKLCSGFHDEYIVNRWKCTYLGTNLRNEKGEKTQQLFRSDFPLIPHLNQAENSLFSIIHDAVAKKISTRDAWNSITRCMYRDIFELLARYAAPIATTNQAQFDNFIDLSQNIFYQKYVVAYWTPIHRELERSYNTNLVEAGTALDNMVKILEGFLENIGVTYRKLANGDCQITIAKS